MTYKENIKAILDCNFAGFKDEIIDSACDRIVEIEQEPKTGHWIYMGLEDDVYGQIVRVFTCSECDAISIFRVLKLNGNIVNGDLCPNCGAKMIGVEEHE